MPTWSSSVENDIHLHISDFGEGFELRGSLTALTNWPLPHRHKEAILKLLLYVKLIETMEIQELY